MGQTIINFVTGFILPFNFYVKPKSSKLLHLRLALELLENKSQCEFNKFAVAKFLPSFFYFARSMGMSQRTKVEELKNVKTQKLFPTFNLLLFGENLTQF